MEREEYEIDCPAYGRLGLSGGMVADPSAALGGECALPSLGRGERAGRLNQPAPTLIQGVRSASTFGISEFLRRTAPGL